METTKKFILLYGDKDGDTNKYTINLDETNENFFDFYDTVGDARFDAMMIPISHPNHWSILYDIKKKKPIEYTGGCQHPLTY